MPSRSHLQVTTQLATTLALVQLKLELLLHKSLACCHYHGPILRGQIASLQVPVTVQIISC